MLQASVCHDLEYLDLLEFVLEDGFPIFGRNGQVRQLIGGQMHFDLETGFPMLVTKWVNWRAIVSEFLWMIQGRTDVKWLQDQGHKFWDLWEGEDGTIGKGYGYQFRHAEGIDQVSNLIEGLQNNPYSRRHIINLWNVKDLPDMMLPPCHMMTQWFVEGDELTCLLYQRSADMFLGVPWNIAFYSLFTHVVAKLTGYKPKRFIWSGGSCHVYENHIPAVIQQLDQPITASPQLYLKESFSDIDKLQRSDIILTGYNPGPKISAPISQ